MYLLPGRQALVRSLAAAGLPSASLSLSLCVSLCASSPWLLESLSEQATRLFFSRVRTFTHRKKIHWAHAHARTHAHTGSSPSCSSRKQCVVGSVRFSAPLCQSISRQFEGLPVTTTYVRIGRQATCLARLRASQAAAGERPRANLGADYWQAKTAEILGRHRPGPQAGSVDRHGYGHSEQVGGDRVGIYGMLAPGLVPDPALGAHAERYLAAGKDACAEEGDCEAVREEDRARE